MEIIPISPQIDEARKNFLRFVFEGGEGYFCVAYGPKDRDPKKFRQEFFSFPDEIPLALDLVNQIYQGHNVWFCPHLFTKRERKKEYVSYTGNAWADLDTCEPENLHVKPTIVLESSPGRFQGLWIFDKVVDPYEAQNISQRIAYTHAEEGCDRSGWDLTQLLRFPYTYNYKYGTTPIVKIIEATRSRYRPTDFDDDYEQVATFSHTDREMPDISDLDGEDILERERLKMSPTIWRLYQETPQSESWSESLFKLMMMLFEVGFDARWVFAVVQNAACNKYERDGMPQQMLWADVVRAEHMHAQRSQESPAPTTGGVQPLVTEEERSRVMVHDSIVERYITWAKSLGDAAPQYHQAGAFTALSALLAGNVQLPTSFGVIKPNLWFMILADTTLTRKSTAMDIAMDLVTEIDDDIVMATDGSIEGLLTSLSNRTSRPSVFLRDEFSGLLEMITKKDYYAGMPELLTKLYDGKMQKRILRKESVEVRDPCLLVFAGGIKNKITSLLTFEHVSSGFMPRFIFITAESDITRVKPLGPPTDWTDSNRGVIQAELQDLWEFYNQEEIRVVAGTNVPLDRVKKKFDAELTQEAWYRYNQLEDQMLQAGMASERPDIMTPVFDRLSKSILKAAVLLATTRKTLPVVVEEDDVVRAACYGEGWRTYVLEVMDNVGKGTQERQYDTVRRFIERKGSVNRSVIMQNYHLNARQTTEILETLEQRGWINRIKNGKNETVEPTIRKVKEKV